MPRDIVQDNGDTNKVFLKTFYINFIVVTNTTFVKVLKKSFQPFIINF